MAGRPARLAGTVKKSAIYIERGSSNLSPNLKGNVGEVGVKIRSTFWKAS